MAVAHTSSPDHDPEPAAPLSTSAAPLRGVDSRLATSDEGLSSAEAQRRLAAIGPDHLFKHAAYRLVDLRRRTGATLPATS